MLWIFLSFFVFFLLRRIIKKHQNYFEDHDIKSLKSTPLLGMFDDFIFGRKNLFEIDLDIYNHPDLKDEPFFGVFHFQKPALLIKDMKLIKKITAKDSHYFINRTMTTDEKDPLNFNIASARHPDWKRIRSKISRIFTSSKLKTAYHLIDDISDLLCHHIGNKVESGNSSVDLKKTFGLYTIDVTANVLFGFNPKSLDGVIDDLHEALYSTMEVSLKRFLDFAGVFLMPSLFKIFNLKLLGEKYTKFAIDLMEKVFDERKKSGKIRNDFIDLLMELKSNHELKDDEIFPQAGGLFFAGFETTSSSLSFIFYELSKNQKVQEKLREEIRQYFTNNGKVSYEAVATSVKLPYLDRVVQETLRLHTIGSHVDRVCMKSDGYSLEPMSSFKIPQGMPVLIPLYGLAHDEKYFDDPFTFNPDRENYRGRSLPFGIGARVCFGERIALIILKTAIIKVLKDFRVEMNEKTPEKLTIWKRAFILQYNEILNVTFVKE